MPESSGAYGTPQDSGTGMTWLDYREKAWRRVFKTQYDMSIMAPIHEKIATKINLKEYCKTNQLVPIPVAYDVPENETDFNATLTKLQDKLYTDCELHQKDSQEEGTILIPSGTTLKEVWNSMNYDQIKIHDAKTVEDDVRQELREKMKSTRTEIEEQLSTYSEGAYIDALKTREKLEKDYFQATSEKTKQCISRYLDQLDQDMQMYAKVTQCDRQLLYGEVIKAVGNKASATELLWMEMDLAGSFSAACPLLKMSLNTRFEFEKLAADEYGQVPSVTPKPGPLLTKKILVDDLQKEYNRYDDQKKQAEKERDEALKQGQGSCPEKAKAAKGTASKKSQDIANLKVLMDSVKAQKNEAMKGGETVVNKLNNEVTLQRAILMEAVGSQEEEFKELMKKGIRFTAVWTTNEKLFRSFPWFRDNSCEMKSESDKHVTQDTQSTRAAVGVNVGLPGVWGAEGSVGMNHGTKTEEAKSNLSEKAKKYLIEFEAATAPIHNDRLDRMIEAMSNAHWSINGKPPGYLWKDRRARYVVKEIVLIRRFIQWFESSEGASELVKTSNETLDALSAKVTAAYGGFGGSVDAAHEHGKAEDHATSKMTVASTGNMILIPQWHIKFLLLEPLTPAPILNGISEESPDSAAVDELDDPKYAATWLGTGS